MYPVSAAKRKWMQSPPLCGALVRRTAMSGEAARGNPTGEPPFTQDEISQSTPYLRDLANCLNAGLRYSENDAVRSTKIDECVSSTLAAMGRGTHIVQTMGRGTHIRRYMRELADNLNAQLRNVEDDAVRAGKLDECVNETIVKMGRGTH